MPGVNSVRILKEDLLKEVSRPSGDGRTEKILDILKSLDKVDMNLAILTEVSDIHCWNACGIVSKYLQYSKNKHMFKNDISYTLLNNHI